jgi:tripartite-type tricarboxylate transporter receptor subunit TctC
MHFTSASVARLAGAALLLGASALAQAQQASWPNRQVAIVAPVPSGGGVDILSRALAQKLGESLGSTFIVENRPGASAAIGTSHVVRSPADGHTLLMGLPSLVFLPDADRIRGRAPAYEMTDFAPIARVLADPMLLAVPVNSPWRSAQDFVADAKARPEAITYASSGIYGTLHIATEMFAQAAGVKFTHVPYTGAGPALAAVLSGTTDFLAATPGVIKGAVDGGRLRVLANFGAARNPGFPDAPTWMELGFAGVEYYNWAGLFAPSPTPAPIRAELERAMKSAIEDADTVRAFTTGGADPAWLDTEQFTAFIKADTDRLVAVVRRIGNVG